MEWIWEVIRSIQGDAKVFGLSIWENGADVSRDGETRGGAGWEARLGAPSMNLALNKGLNAHLLLPC